jgi:hypothetical protein
MTIMRSALTLTIVLFTFGCGSSTKTYELAGNSFTAKYLKIVEQNTGIKFPPGSRGLNMIYKGYQIDAGLLAKVEIPVGSEAFIETQLRQLPVTNENLRSGLTGEVNWWNAPKGTVHSERMLLHGHDLVHVLLSEETGHSIVYIEWYQ